MKLKKYNNYLNEDKYDGNFFGEYGSQDDYEGQDDAQGDDDPRAGGGQAGRALGAARRGTAHAAVGLERESSVA